MQTPQQQPHNEDFVWTGFHPVKYSPTMWAKELFFFNQQPVTLFEFYCSFLRIGTGLEIEAEFTNTELRGVTVCC